MAFYKKIIGDRIYLSPKNVSEETVQKYTEWMNSFQVTDYIDNSANLYSYTAEKEFLEKSAKDTDNVNFDIVNLENNTLLGSIALIKIKPVPRSATLGVFIGDCKYLGKGYGTEAIRLILEYAFKYLNLHSVKLEVLSCNERAHKCYLKCGFKDTGYARDRAYINGKYYNELHMDILDTEFTGSYIRNKNI